MQRSDIITIAIYVVGAIAGAAISHYAGNETWRVVAHGLLWPMFFASFIWGDRF